MASFNPNHLPKVSPPNTIEELEFQHMNWGFGTNVEYIEPCVFLESIWD